MKIQICDWRSSGPLLEGSAHKHGDLIEGNADDAFRIARELYDRGLNVMVKRQGGRNLGTRKTPNIQPESILVAVDTHRFQQM